MRVDGNVVSTLLLVAFSAKFSKQEKPEDCVLGKEFLSTFFNSNGVCALCPRYLANCDDQGPDKEACEKSCGAIASSVRSTSRSFPVVKIVASSTVLLQGKPTEYKEIHDGNEPHLWVILLVVLATALVFGAIVVLLLFLFKCRKKMRRNVNDRFGPFRLGHPIQASPSSLKIGGIQDSEEKQDSAMHLDETDC